jgi:hypothetical protein
MPSLRYRDNCVKPALKCLERVEKLPRERYIRRAREAWKPLSLRLFGKGGAQNRWQWPRQSGRVSMAVKITMVLARARGGHALPRALPQPTRISHVCAMGLLALVLAAAPVNMRSVGPGERDR